MPFGSNARVAARSIVHGVPSTTMCSVVAKTSGSASPTPEPTSLASATPSASHWTAARSPGPGVPSISAPRTVGSSVAPTQPTKCPSRWTGANSCIRSCR